MKHLTPYKIFETNYPFLTDSLKEEIKDILQDLHDIGFFINISPTPMTIVGRNTKGEFYIYLDKDNRKSYLESREELEILISSLEHLLSYIKKVNFKTVGFYFDNSSFNTLTESLISKKRSIRQILEMTFGNTLDLNQVDIGDYIFFKFREK